MRWPAKLRVMSGSAGFGCCCIAENSGRRGCGRAWQRGFPIPACRSGCGRRGPARQHQGGAIFPKGEAATHFGHADIMRDKGVGTSVATGWAPLLPSPGCNAVAFKRIARRAVRGQGDETCRELYGNADPVQGSKTRRAASLSESRRRLGANYRSAQQQIRAGS